MNNNKITAGDVVDVFWENVQCESGMEVLYIPCATGDSWILKRPNGTIVYINEYAKMVKQANKKENNDRVPKL